MRTLVLAIVVAVAALSAAPVRAQPPGRSACRADLDKFCKDVAPGGGRILACLHSHLSELSPECREHVEAMKAAGHPHGGHGMAGVMGACRDDVAKHCKDVPRGGGRILGCLREHEADLSKACRDALK
jgi:hypothetical protein